LCFADSPLPFKVTSWLDTSRSPLPLHPALVAFLDFQASVTSLAKQALCQPQHQLQSPRLSRSSLALAMPLVRWEEIHPSLGSRMCLLLRLMLRLLLRLLVHCSLDSDTQQVRWVETHQ
jgi:hypothetical protein